MSTPYHRTFRQEKKVAWLIDIIEAISPYHFGNGKDLSLIKSLLVRECKDWDLANKLFISILKSKNITIKPTENVKTDMSYKTLFTWLKKENPEFYDNRISTGLKEMDDYTPYFEIEGFSHFESKIHVNKPYLTNLRDGKFSIPKDLELPLRGNCLIKSFLGTGKTNVLDLKIKEMKEEKTVLMFTPRITYSNNVAKRLNLTSYTVKIDSNRQLISIESLYKLKSVEWDLVILDEVTSVINQLRSPFIPQEEKSKVITMFHQILKNSKQILMLDAFIIIPVSQLINSLGLKFNYIYNSFEPARNIVKLIPCMKKFGRVYKSDISALFKKITELLKDGKKLFMVSSSKQKADEIYYRLKDKYKIAIYTSEKGNRKDFENVETEWKKYQLIICSTTLTVGVDFSESYFDYKICYMSASGAIVRDLIQSLYRVRKIKGRKIFVSIYDKCINEKHYLSRDSILNVLNDRKGCMKEFGVGYSDTKWYKKIMASSLFERSISKWHFKKVLFEYFRYCRFMIGDEKIKPEDFDLGIAVNKLSFDEVGNIDFKELKELKLKLYKNGRLSEEEHTSIEKYFFLLNFHRVDVSVKCIYDEINLKGEIKYKRWLRFIVNKKKKNFDKFEVADDGGKFELGLTISKRLCRKLNINPYKSKEGVEVDESDEFVEELNKWIFNALNILPSRAKNRSMRPITKINHCLRWFFGGKIVRKYKQKKIKVRGKYKNIKTYTYSYMPNNLFKNVAREENIRYIRM